MEEGGLEEVHFQMVLIISTQSAVSALHSAAV